MTTDGTNATGTTGGTGTMSFTNATIGINSVEIGTYLSNVNTQAISPAVEALTSGQEALFSVFRENWKGTSEKNFEQNMKTATNRVIATLEKHYTTFANKIYAIHQAWIQQDEGMVPVVDTQPTEAIPGAYGTGDIPGGGN